MIALTDLFGSISFSTILFAAAVSEGLVNVITSSSVTVVVVVVLFGVRFFVLVESGNRAVFLILFRFLIDSDSLTSFSSSESRKFSLNFDGVGAFELLDVLACPSADFILSVFGETTFDGVGALTLVFLSFVIV